MDLAKIRRKALQTHSQPDECMFTAPSTSPGSLKNVPGAIPSVPVSSEVDFFQQESHSHATPLASTVDAPPLRTAVVEEHGVSSFTPLEALLAARTAAGCDTETIISDDATSLIIAESYQEFLCFRVSDEIYGINIMDIKEIIKPRVVTEVPRTPAFVSGILSLRGTIIPIVDMRIRLGLAFEAPTGKERIVVVKNSDSFSGLLVDEVIQVVKVQMESVEAVPSVIDGIDRDFISGLGRSDGRLIIILNLETITDINLY